MVSLLAGQPVKGTAAVFIGEGCRDNGAIVEDEERINRFP